MGKHSKGGYCGNCMRNNLEGTEDKHGMWHYRCPYCVAHQNPKDIPCPRCGCTAHEQVCGSLPFDYSQEALNAIVNNPFRPDVTLYRCLNCSFEWNTPEYERYLLMKVVVSVSEGSEFHEKE